MIMIVMGVSGSGKTTIGKQLAGQLDWSFADADDFHPPDNIAKMRAGIALQDEDRWPWLEAIRHFIEECLQQNVSVVIACSALKRTYRHLLAADDRDRVRFVFLQGSYELIKARLQKRRGHFFDETLLRSQFETLEEPRDAFYVDAAYPPDVIVAHIQRHL